MSKLDAAQPITKETHQGVASPPSWAADSRHIFFPMDNDGDGQIRWYSVDVKTQRQVLLTPTDPKIRAGIGHQQPMAWTQRDVVLMTLREDGGSSLYEVNVATGKRKLVERLDPENQVNYVDSNLRPRLALKRSSAGGLDLYVRRDQGWVFLAKWSQRNDTGVSESYILGIEAGDTSALLLTSLGRDKPILVRIDLATGSQRVLAEDSKASLTDEVWIDPHSGALQAYTTEYLTKKHIALVPEVRADIARLDAELGPQYTVTARAANDDIWTIDLNDAVKGVASYLYDRRSGALTKLFDAWPRLAHQPLQPTHPIEIPARDGLLLPSYLTLPPGTDSNHDGRPDRPLPMVINVHGGPVERDLYVFRPDAQWFANRGYAVCWR